MTASHFFKAILYNWADLAKKSVSKALAKLFFLHRNHFFRRKNRSTRRNEFAAILSSLTMSRGH